MLRRHAPAFAVVGALALALGFLVFCPGCAMFQGLSPEQKIAICQESIRVAAQPECERLRPKGDEYVDLCNAVANDAIVACDAGISEDPALLCGRIGEHAAQCALIPDSASDRDQNVATCERVVRGLGLLCLVGTADRAEPEGSAPSVE